MNIGKEIVKKIKQSNFKVLSVPYIMSFYHDDSGIMCCLPDGKLLNFSEFMNLLETLGNYYSHNLLLEPSHAVVIPPELENFTKPEEKQKSGVYVIKSGNLYKIGCSSNIPKRTKKIIQGLIPYDAEVIIRIRTKNYYDLESSLHDKYKEKRIRGEWFELDESDIDYIRSL